MAKFSVIAIAAVLLLAVASPVASFEDVTLTELLSSKPEYSVLVELLTFTELVEPLQNMSALTMFAPTNFGFKLTGEDIGCDDMDAMTSIASCFKNIGKETLSEILKYHVVPVQLSSEQVLRRNRFGTLAGKVFNRRGLRLSDENDDFVNPKLIATNLDARYQSGYVHAINRVLMLNMDDGGTDDTPNLVKLLEMKGGYKVLLHLLNMTGLADAVSEMKDMTIFAPTDRAFSKTGMALGCTEPMTVRGAISCYENLLDKETLTEVLKYHVTMGLYPSQRVMATSVFKMFNDVFLFRHKSVFVDQAPGYPNAFLAKGAMDMMYDNGIVHGIGRVLIPLRTLEPSKPCDTFEYPISLADTSYLPLFKIVIGARQCSDVLSAMKDCSIRSKTICSGNRGDKTAADDISIGRAVATAKQCSDVVIALRACRAAM